LLCRRPGQGCHNQKSIGTDIGKETYPIVAFNSAGQIALRKEIKRLGLESEYEKLPPSIVGLDACLSAHFVRRSLRRLGHRSINCQDQGARDMQLRTCENRNRTPS
jgi:hypothetical protein